ncbi:hypothetical protein K469DRAFT_744224 [Zopfia rhizophila CBS 207.26]|uniref:Uncharacterized protein n=1 Tax=Zopfia rhizophila CBS 207.26 TaxID=1314779 RepID=A0A6A6EX03_9PEZI|nr:hypothetical protein K469DRAFT_744224 [Zopfia rhizophila CBS 207.26]
MPQSHRPDFDAQFTNRSFISIAERTAAVWLYINQEDLLKPKTLPIFINARGRQLPDVFDTSGFENAAKCKAPFEQEWSLVRNYAMKYTWRFLVDCCMHILQDIPRTSLTSSDVAIQPKPPRLASKDAVYDSLCVIKFEAPNRVPERLDFERFRTLVSGDATKAEDYIRALGEDPSFFAETARDTRITDLRFFSTLLGNTTMYSALL